MIRIRNPLKKGGKKKLVQIGIGKLLWESINLESEDLHWNFVPARSVCKNKLKHEKVEVI